MDESNSESDLELTPPNSVEAVKTVSLNLIPEISKEKYTTTYKSFMDWQKEQKTNSYSENVLLAYFGELANKFKPSTLWAQYSMLKTTLNINHSVDLANYVKLKAFLKRKADGYRPKKSKFFTSDEINKFIKEAPDKEYLLAKLVLVMGVTGACRRNELHKMKTTNFKDLGSAVLVEIPNRITTKRFTITGHFYDIFKKYVDLRPHNVNDPGFFLNYQKGKCTVQRVGINKLGNMGKQIATFLKLPNPGLYTGHCFHRSSATGLVDAGVYVTALKWPDDREDDTHQLTQRNFLKEFIEMYKSLPEIWNVEYKKSDANHAAYEKLVTKLKEVEPDADKNAVIRKIHSLRSAFNAEHRKVQLANEWGGKYKPVLWYYDLMMFSKNDNKDSNGLEQPDSLSTDEPIENVYVKKEDVDTFEEAKPNLLGPTCDSNTAHVSYMDASSRIHPLTSSSDQDEFDVVGLNVSSKLRNMDKTQRIIAERIIAETLFQGQMGTLTVRDSCSNMLPSVQTMTEFS